MSSKTYSIFKLILGTIKERMKDLEMDTKSLNIRAIRFLLPENPHTKEDYVNTVKQIMYESHIIDDDTLVDTLALEDASEEQRVSHWAEDQAEFPEMDLWIKFADKYVDRPFHLRYIGQTKGKAAVFRHIDKMRRGSHLSTYGSSLSIVQQAQSRLARRVTLEQNATAFFGLDNLLNTQSGGYCASYEPPSSYFKEFRELWNLEFFETFRRHATKKMAPNDLRSYIQQISSEAIRIESPMESSLLKALCKQAQCKLVNNYAILVLIGYDIACSDYKKGRQFSNSREPAS
ncbi:hypothetical protein VTP01DRAFT_8865 [Rhizomucor pusillus]|uniref:uncharacterized protein n=1 Tax=Rhizomucor pusillus TaxID=4840 RepID=UPI00374459F9